MRTTRLYVNTLVFTVLAGFVSLILLAMLAFGVTGVAAYAPLIITIEVGVVVIIVSAIVRIYWFEQRTKKHLKNFIENKLRVKTCPDYWTAEQEGTGALAQTVCNNTYAVPDSHGDTIRINSSVPRITLEDWNRRPLKDLCRNLGALGAPWTNIKSMCDSYDMSIG
jgi:hypothetical protein